MADNAAPGRDANGPAIRCGAPARLARALAAPGCGVVTGPGGMAVEPGPAQDEFAARAARRALAGPDRVCGRAGASHVIGQRAARRLVTARLVVALRQAPT
jgi:hypothetical protein